MACWSSTGFSNHVVERTMRFRKAAGADVPRFCARLPEPKCHCVRALLFGRYSAIASIRKSAAAVALLILRQRRACQTSPLSLWFH